MQSIRQLVPEFIYAKYRAGETSGIFQGAAMFADLSGFSTMTDVLSTRGTHGAEVLADMMRVVFEPLVDAVYEQGGFVIGYAGDAFNAVFPAGQDSDQAMKRCLAAALKIQARTQSRPRISTPYGEFVIRNKVGLGFGETRWQIFKSTSGKRASYWFRGESLDGAVFGEEHARAGDIVADPVSFDLLKDILRVSPVDECYMIEEVAGELPAPLPLPHPKPADDLSGIFFADSVYRLPISGEFRQAVNLFVDIPANISDEALIAPFMETVYLLQEQYGGFFLRPDLGDKGFNLLMFWGAPTAHENDVDRALNFILELSARTHITLRAGITYRLAYAGFIGSGKREDYTAYGWGVNLAARMMEHAGEGEFWMDEEVARRASRHFNMRSLGAYRFKGFKQEQKVYALSGRKSIVKAVYQGRLIGRGAELESLASFADPLRRGEFAGVMVLKGEAGIGKSRLAHSFQYSDFFKDLPANWVVCQADEILRLPLNPFKDWLKKRFEYLESASNELNAAAFMRSLQELIAATTDPELSAELARTSSVLAALINISQPNSLYESLDAKGRYENTLIALGALLRAESMQKPLVLFMEDTHWLDEDTGAFLSYFVRGLLSEPDRPYPIAIIATQRPEGESVQMVEEVATSSISLGGLSSANMSRLAEEVLGGPVAESLPGLLDSRADGNPFFAEQILRYLLEHDALAVDADGKYFAEAGTEVSLPADVRALLVARLDRLAQQVKETVQTASVLGREFEVRVLGNMLQPDEEGFLHSMAQAENANIWAPLSEIEYIFRHALLRDAAYSMQLQVRQRELHGLAVSAMEAIYGNDLESHYGELAYHSGKADLREKALHYLTLAGKLALGVYRNQRAIDYFTQALAFVPEGDLRAEFDILIERAEAYYRVSQFNTQSSDLDRLERLANQLGLDELIGRTLSKRAYYFSSQGDYQNAIQYADKAKSHSEAAGDHSSLLSAYMVTQSALLHIGQTEEAMSHAKDALGLAIRFGDRRGESAALTALGLIAFESEGPSNARHYHERALDISHEAKDRYLEAKILNNLANVVAFLGDYPAAQDYYSQSLLIFQEQGDLAGKGLIWLNLGWLAGMLGDFSIARDNYEKSLSILRKIGSRMEEMFTYINLGAVEIAQGHIKETFAWLAKAFELSTSIGDRAAIGWIRFYTGHAHLINSQYDLAVQAFLESIEIRSQINAPALVMESRAGLCETYLISGNLNAAKKEVGQIAEYIEQNRTLEGVEEPHRVFLAVIEVFKKLKDPRSQIALQYAVQLMETQVMKLRSEESRRKFIDNVPWRRKIWQQAKTGDLTF